MTFTVDEDDLILYGGVTVIAVIVWIFAQYFQGQKQTTASIGAATVSGNAAIRKECGD